MRFIFLHTVNILDRRPGVTGQILETFSDCDRRILEEGILKVLIIDYTVEATGTLTSDVENLLVEVPNTVTEDYENIQGRLESVGVDVKSVCDTAYEGELPENPKLHCQTPSPTTTSSLNPSSSPSKSSMPSFLPTPTPSSNPTVFATSQPTSSPTMCIITLQKGRIAKMS